jgi:hypothetical protein
MGFDPGWVVVEDVKRVRGMWCGIARLPAVLAGEVLCPRQPRAPAHRML